MPSESSTAGKCFFCRNDEFRRSHFHLSDLPRLILLQLPVRCLQCRKRQYIGVALAMKAKSTKMRFAGDPKVSEVWRDWLSDKPVQMPTHDEGAEPVPEGAAFAQANPLRERSVKSITQTGKSGSTSE